MQASTAFYTGLGRESCIRLDAFLCRNGSDARGLGGIIHYAEAFCKVAMYASGIFSGQRRCVLAV